MTNSDLSTLIIISHGFPKDEHDSHCLPAQHGFVKALKKVFPNLNIIVVALQYPPCEKEYHFFGSKVFSFNSKKYGTLLRPLLWKKVFSRLNRLNHGRDTGVLSLWYAETALIGKFYARKHNLKHYCWILGQDARKKNFFTRWLSLRPNELIAMSDFLSDEFHLNHGKRPSFIVPNAVNPAEFEAFPPGNRSIDILGVGSLLPLKQFHEFVNVVAALKKDNPAIKSVLCGMGPEEARLRNQIMKLDLQETISLTGEIAHERVLAFMQQSKILLHPSSYEGYSAACLEALYAGCHVVSFTQAENRDIDHWHVVNSTEEMISESARILKGNDFFPVLVYTMEDSARKMVELFKRM